MLPTLAFTDVAIVLFGVAFVVVLLFSWWEQRGQEEE